LKLKPRFTPVLVYLLLLSMLTACGFKLRGSLDLSGDIEPVAVDTSSLLELSRIVRSMLEQNNVSVITEDNRATQQPRSTIRLLSESRQRRVLSVDGSGRATEYQLQYRLQYALLTDTMAEKIYNIELQRNLVFEPTAVLAVENQAEVLYQDMQKDAARLILLKLQAISQPAAVQRAQPENSMP
jgi:LPS-assembly lipoprotein